MSRLSDISAQVDRDLAAVGELSRRISAQLNVMDPGRGAQEHGPRVTVSPSSGMAGATATDSQQAHLRELIGRYTARTSTSKQLTQRHRKVLADSRAVVGFRGNTKEMLYPIAARRARGSWLEDVDGNRYVDITMGFGALLFGHQPDFVGDAINKHLSDGLRLGPRAVETGEAAELLTELTGMERVAFANSGTEANSAAIRLARAATGRGKIVTFSGSYHGHADNVLGRSAGSGAGRRTVPVSTGIPPSAVADLLVLDYGDPTGLEVIEEFADEIAAVVVEPVQSRNPSLRPMEFVRRLREVTRRHDIVLMFDEMLTGLRFAPGGAQDFYGVSADLATYGKALGGGFPIGAIAGRSDILDGVDGGFWRYGDDSYPPADTTFYGGTYIQHPVAMVAAKAVLTHLTEQGPELQRHLNVRTDELADVLNRFFEAENFPLRMRNFGSMFRFEHRADMDLLYYHLMLRGVHIWEWRNFFLSTAHSASDIEFIADAVRESLRELRGAGFFPAGHSPRPRPQAPATAPARTAERVSAMPLNAAATVRAPRRAPDFSIYFFGDYPEDETPRDGKYELIAEVARFADEHDFHALWMPERHFHSFGGLFPNPAVLAAALARETRRLRLNAGSVVLPLHDPIRVAEEWSMVDNLSGGRVGIGCAGGWHPNDFVFFPDRFGRHKELMYEQVEVVRSLWRGEKVRRRTGEGEREVRLFPRPVQEIPAMYTAVVANPASYEAAAQHDMGVVTNLMSQSVEQLAENIARYRRARAAHGLDPNAGRVAVLLHTYLAADHDSARREAYDPMRRYMKASMSLFGSFTNSLGYNVDLTSLDEEDLDFVFRRAYDRYCEHRALIGTPETVASVVDEVSAAGADEIVSLVDFGVAPEALRSGLPHLDRLRRAKCRPAREHDRELEREPARGLERQPEREAARKPEREAARKPEREPARESEREPAREPAELSADCAPLSAAQWRLWFLDRMSPEVRACNELKAVRLDGPLDASALHTALRRLVERHGQLRTVVRMVHGDPRQLLLPHAEPDFAIIDRPAAAGTDEQSVVRAVVADEGSRRFDLENGPLFVTRLVRLGEDRYLLVLCMHHVIVDAVSLAVMARDLSALYRAELEHTAAELPVLHRSYTELSHAPQDPRETSRCLEYWRRILGGDLPVLAVPCDRPRPAEMTFGGGNVFQTLDAELSEELRALSRGHRCTIFMTLLAGYAAMLHHATGQDDIIIGTPVSQRPPEAEDVVGLFLNPVALRLDLSGDPELRALLGQVRRAVVDACDHLAVPFETVVSELAPGRVGNRTPIFQTYAEFESGEPFQFDLPGVRATVLEHAPDRALTDLTMYFVDQPGGIGCQLQYNVDLFDAATAERLVDRFRQILERAVRAPDAPLSRLATTEAGVALAPPVSPVSPAWEEGPCTSIEEITVHELIARRAEEAPNRTAIVCGDTVLTYGELEEQAGRFATAVTERVGKPSPDGLIALWLPPSPELIVAMLGALKAGYGFLPLDPGIGEVRAETVLADCGARALVCVKSLSSLRLPPDMAVFDISDLVSTSFPPAKDAGGDPDSLCYVIYTSGSTGKPKGVAISHRNLVNMCQWQHRWFGLIAADRSALLCSHGFDASVLEIWPPLTAGASLAIPDEEVRLDPRALARWYAATSVTYSLLPTPLGEALMALDPKHQPPLRHLAVGGDVLRTRPHADAPYQVTNIYGPTETTVVCAAATVEPETRAPGVTIPVGRPVDNVRLRVLDEAGRPVPVGAIGELYIGGAAVGRGYWRMPEQTATRFVPDPLDATAGLMYRSGDLVRWNEEGAMEFCGRSDDQVKIRGFRVEPEEVTRVLGRLDEVREAVVVSRRNTHAEAYLAAFVVPAPGVVETEPRLLAERLTAALADRLPEYLIPRAWEILSAMPVNINGKLDRVALPQCSIVTTLSGKASQPAPGNGQTELVDRLRRLWSTEFGIDPNRIGPDMSFFDLGGHSIAVIRLVNRILEEFDIDFPLPRFYQQPTLRAMATYLSETGPALRTPRAADGRVTGRL
jgi:iturin family lipopeptide synthetase A